MSENRLRLQTYSKVWRLERMIYRIERLPLPFPVSISQIGVFSGTLAFMILLSVIKPIAMLPGTLRYALIPGVVTWFLTKQSLDGKPPHLWIVTMAGYLLGPRRLGGFAPLRGPQRIRVRPIVACRYSSSPTQVLADGGLMDGLSDQVL